MKDWLLFTLALLIGGGMLVAGLVYRRKEKDDPESVKIYSVISVVGILVVALAVIMRFCF